MLAIDRPLPTTLRELLGREMNLCAIVLIPHRFRLPGAFAIALVRIVEISPAIDAFG